MKLNKQDMLLGYDGVFLPDLLEKKYKNAAKELVWRWFFPAKNLTTIKKLDERRRYHIHESTLQKNLKIVVGKAGIPNQVTSHTSA